MNKQSIKINNFPGTIMDAGRRIANRPLNKLIRHDDPVDLVLSDEKKRLPHILNLLCNWFINNCFIVPRGKQSKGFHFTLFYF